MAQYFALAILLAVYLVHLSYVDSEARTCYFGPPPAPDPDNPDPHHWMKQALEQIRKNCPGRRGSTVVKCQPLPAPNKGTVTSCTKDGHSRVTTDRQPVGTKCDVACDGGYTLSGFSSRICLENGTWNGTDAKCTGITCASSALLAPVNGTKGDCNGDYVSYGGVCTMSCNTGYKPISAVQIACGSDDNGNGVWSADTFNCTAIRCAVNDSLAPVNGSTTGCSGDYGESCMLSCAQGFKPTTSMVVTCKSDDSGDGVWSTMCTRITCASSDLPAPVNGTKGGCNGDYVSYGGVCTMSCNTGYKPISAVQITCGSDDNGNGVWSADTFNCTAIRCAVNDSLAPVNGSTTGCSGDYGESCMLSCAQGFKPTTSMVVTCKSDDSGDGVWSTMCTRITCASSDLPAPVNGTKGGCNGDYVSYGGVCTMSCNTGYKPISAVQIACGSDDNGNGVWSADTFNCTGITCASSDLPAPVNGRKSGCGDQVPYGDICTPSCNTGYKPVSAVQITCGSDDNGNGEWSADTFQCTEITCALSDLHLPANTEITGCSGDDPVPYGTNCTLTYTTSFIQASIEPEACELLTGVDITERQTAGSIMCRDEWLVYKHVGLEYRSIIPNDCMAASSSYSDSNGVRPAKAGRLHNSWHWCPAYSDSNQWIEVDLMTSTVVSGVITQGSAGSQARVTQYQVAYQTTSSPTYVHVLSGTENIKTFSGNIDDAATPVIIFFPESINATRVKIEPLDWYNKGGIGGRGLCLRFELIGCRLN